MGERPHFVTKSRFDPKIEIGENFARYLSGSVVWCVLTKRRERADGV